MSKTRQTDEMQRSGMTSMSLISYHPAAVVVEHVREVALDAAEHHAHHRPVKARIHHAGDAFMTWLETGAAAERRRRREHSL